MAARRKAPSPQPKRLSVDLRRALRAERRARAALIAATAALRKAIAALNKTQRTARQAKTGQGQARRRLTRSATLLERSEAAVTRAETAHARAVATDGRDATGASGIARKAAEDAVIVAEQARDGAARSMTHDAQAYDTANLVVATTQAAAARAAELRIESANYRGEARAAVDAAIVARTRARDAREAARRWRR